MNIGLIFALVIGGVILVGAFAIGIRMNKKMIGEGKIAKRDLDFADYASEFTSRVGSAEAVTSALKSLDYGMIGASMKGNTVLQRFQFTGSGYAAVLERIAYDEPSGIAVYRFNFTQFRMNGSIPQNSLSMNKLLTQIEKMFLAFDPHTGVKSYKVDYNTKHSFF